MTQNICGILSNTIPAIRSLHIFKETPIMFCTCLVRGQVGHEVQVRHLQQEREPSEGRHGRVRPRAGNQRAPVS